MFHCPPAVDSWGQEAIELAAHAGLHLDPWQQFVMRHGLGVAENDEWAAFEVGLIVPRQNGKGSILEARELAGLFLLNEQLILHSAHEFKTATEAFRRIVSLIQNTPDLDKRVKRITYSHGDEGVELKTGQRLRFVARTRGSGRGFSGDCVILDEAYNLSEDSMAALLPTLSARPNPQLWYASSAGQPESFQLAAVRARGLEGRSESLCYCEWSAPDDTPLDDREGWAMANPALGIRISESFIAREREAMPEAEFARERIGIWDELGAPDVIDPRQWEACGGEPRKVTDRPAFAVYTSWDRKWTSIAVCGLAADGKPQVEVLRRGSGTKWVVPRLLELKAAHDPCAIALDPGSAAGSLLADIEEAGIEPVTMTAREAGQACGGFYDAVIEKDVRHLNDSVLDTALGNATQRKLGDAWVFTPKTPAVECTALMAVAFARWAWTVHRNDTEQVVVPSIAYR